MAKIRRNYRGGAVATTTSSAVASTGTTTFTIAANTGWPSGSAPFFVVLEPGTANEEKILVTRAGESDSTLSVYATPNVDANRGLDGTVAVAHSSGSTVYPVFTAQDADEANEMSSVLTTKGDLLTHGASTFARVAAGTNNHVLIADSAQSSGIKWGQVQTAGIADVAVTSAKLASSAVGSTVLADGAVTTAKIADSNVTTAKIADSNVTTAKINDGAVATAKINDGAVTTAKIANSNVTTEKIADGSVTAEKIAGGAIPSGVPTGMIAPFAGASSPSGWLLCQGQSVSRTTYADLFTALGGVSSPYGGVTSTNFNVPDLRTRVPVGLFSTDTDTDPSATDNRLNSLGKTGGEKTHTLTQAQLPSHTHTVGRGASFGTSRVGSAASGGFRGDVVTGYDPTFALQNLSSGSEDMPGTAHNHSVTGGGSGNAHNILQPYLVVNYIIKT
jgi:microcystin-dependent protein